MVICSISLGMGFAGKRCLVLPVHSSREWMGSRAERLVATDWSSLRFLVPVGPVRGALLGFSGSSHHQVPLWLIRVVAWLYS